MITVTQHALDRYCERIAQVDRVTAYASIAASERAIEAAAAFGAKAVKTATAKLIIQVHEQPGGGRDVRVVTVLRRGEIDHSDLTLAERERRFAQHRARFQ